jgi:thiamine-monophosphate kinase
MSDERGEFAYINWIRSRLSADPRVSIGPGDDMAEVQLPGGDRVLVGTDTLLDGVHFDLSRDALDAVGWKALAVNLSDVAAMAAEPLAAVGTVALPRSMSTHQAQELFEGLRRCAEEFSCAWVGGDVTAWDQPLAITVTALAHAALPVRRSGAAVGQLVCVTGELGGSISGRHLTFRPRVAEARQLAGELDLGAMIDLSDGLSSDVGHICEESRVGVVIDPQQLPISEAARQLAERDGRSPLEHALNDGEDFELLFTTAAADADRIAALDIGVPVTIIGRVVAADQGRLLVDASGRSARLESGGYEHWR